MLLLDAATISNLNYSSGRTLSNGLRKASESGIGAR